MSDWARRPLRPAAILLLTVASCHCGGWASVGWGQVHYEVGSDQASPVPLVSPQEVPANKLSIEEIVIEPPGAMTEGLELSPEEIEALTNEQPQTTILPFSYRSRENDWTWVAGGQSGFGMFSLRDTGYLESDEHLGLHFGVGLHFLKGPMEPDLHPRLWDFSVGYQQRGHLGMGIEYDLAFNLGIYSDFEDRARDGVRFPSHAVLLGQIAPRMQWVLGFDYLDRDDYTVLPVVGLRWQPTENLQFKIEIPEPEIDFRYGETGLLYFAGRLGGGTWDIEYVNAGDDVMTYRQWEIVVGLADVSDEGRSGMEFGYLVDRALEFRRGRGNIDLPDIWMFRLVQRY